MSIISNNDPYEAIESAIKSASQKVCEKVDLKKFEPFAETYTFNESSHDFCNRFFSAEIAAKRRQIPKGQQTPNLVSYAGTRGWLHGYSCAQDKAKPVIEKLQETQCNLNKKTEEANGLKAELQELKSRDPEKLAKRRLWGLLIVAVIAIANFISEWQFDWPF